MLWILAGFLMAIVGTELPDVLGVRWPAWAGAAVVAAIPFSMALAVRRYDGAATHPGDVGVERVPLAGYPQPTSVFDTFRSRALRPPVPSEAAGSVSYRLRRPACHRRRRQRGALQGSRAMPVEGTAPSVPSATVSDRDSPQSEDAAAPRPAWLDT